MRANFYRPDTPDAVVGAAVWAPGDVRVEAEDESIRQAIGRIFRRTPVVVDDPSLRPSGTSGPVVLPPGSLSWFRAAAEAHSQAEGLGVRFVPAAQGAMGWDPAGAYRSFSEAMERMELLGGPPGTEPVQPGEAVAAGAQS